MRYFLISTVFLLVSCGSYPKKNNFEVVHPSEKTIHNPYFADGTQDYVYKADIKLYKKSFSGIFVAKKLGENHHRVVFTTEMGNKIFDFSFEGDDFEINHILPDMNKKIVLNLLQEDFRTLLKEKLRIEDSFSSESALVYKTTLYGIAYYFYSTSGQLEKIVKAKGSNPKVSYNFSEINDANAKNIQILHHNVKLSIVLKAI